MTDQQRLEFIYESVTSKLPDSAESAKLLTLKSDLEKYYTEEPELAATLCEGMDGVSDDVKVPLAAWTVVVNTVLNLDITKTRE